MLKVNRTSEAIPLYINKTWFLLCEVPIFKKECPIVVQSKLNGSNISTAQLIIRTKCMCCVLCLENFIDRWMNPIMISIKFIDIYNIYHKQSIDTKTKYLIQKMWWTDSVIIYIPIFYVNVWKYTYWYKFEFTFYIHGYFRT